MSIQVRFDVPRTLRDSWPALRVGLVVMAIWAGLGLFGLMRDNPFEVARAAAAEAAGAAPHETRFLEGSYGYWLLWSVASAEVRLSSDPAGPTAHIEMIHLPIVGWSTRTFAVEPGPARDGSLRNG